MPEGLGDVKWELGAAKFGLQRKLVCGLRFWRGGRKDGAPPAARAADKSFSKAI